MSAPARAKRAAAAHAKPDFWDIATRELARRDRVLAKLIAAHPDIHLTRRGDPFTTLARSIVGQQISVKAAQAVWDRFARAAARGSAATGAGNAAAGVGNAAIGVGNAAIGTLAVALDPARVARMRVTTMRRCGFSERKADYVRDLARHFVNGRLEPHTWSALDDEALIEALIDVKGIGRWTAEMFLMFHEVRADVLPIADIGLQNAMALHYNKGERMLPAQMRECAERWAPWRSVATWYLWRSLDPVPVEY